MKTTKLTGFDAIAFAVRFGQDVQKYADPTGPAGSVDVVEAREIAKEDPSLLYVEVPAFDATEMLATFAAVGNDGSRPVVWGLGTSAEMAFADALLQEGFEVNAAPYLKLRAAGPEVQERVQHGDVSWSNA